MPVSQVLTVRVRFCDEKEYKVIDALLDMVEIDNVSREGI